MGRKYRAHMKNDLIEKEVTDFEKKVGYINDHYENGLEELRTALGRIWDSAVEACEEATAQASQECSMKHECLQVAYALADLKNPK